MSKTIIKKDETYKSYRDKVKQDAEYRKQYLPKVTLWDEFSFSFKLYKNNWKKILLSQIKNLLWFYYTTYIAFSIGNIVDSILISNDINVLWGIASKCLFSQFVYLIITEMIFQILYYFLEFNPQGFAFYCFEKLLNKDLDYFELYNTQNLTDFVWRSSSIHVYNNTFYRVQSLIVNLINLFIISRQIYQLSFIFYLLSANYPYFSP